MISYDKSGRPYFKHSKHDSPNLVRWRTVRYLGFRDYDDYLQSDLWAGIRDKTLVVFRRCRGCGKTATTIHLNGHGVETILGDNPAAIYPVCHECHRDINFRGTARRGIKESYGYAKRLFYLKRKHKKSAKRASKRNRNECSS